MIPHNPRPHGYSYPPRSTAPTARVPMLLLASLPPLLPLPFSGVVSSHPSGVPLSGSMRGCIPESIQHALRGRESNHVPAPAAGVYPGSASAIHSSLPSSLSPVVDSSNPTIQQSSNPSSNASGGLFRKGRRPDGLPKQNPDSPEAHPAAEAEPGYLF